jgi:dihydroorotate dehydrogenase
VYSLLYRHLLARLDAEAVHHRALAGLEVLGALTPARELLRSALAVDTAGMAVEAMGLRFAHPLGLAAGFDKDGRCLPALHALGFSFAEVGTVTPRPQPGNPPPRLFRLTEDKALINRLGFPSEGAEMVSGRLHRSGKSLFPVGVSLGKNKDTPLMEAVNDYIAVLRQLYPYGDFFVVNISSPNTPDLRRLQTRDYLSDLLLSLMEAVRELGGAAPKPLLIKIAPDLTWGEIDILVELALLHKVAGVVATNTTTRRDGLRGSAQRESGGLSGQPLRERSTEIISYLYQAGAGRLCIVGVGGVFAASDAWEKLRAGATLVQAYTGFIYEGPAFVRRVLRGLRERMRAEGVTHLAEIVGTG